MQIYEHNGFLIGKLTPEESNNPDEWERLAEMMDNMVDEPELGKRESGEKCSYELK